MATIEEALELERLELDIFRGASTKTQLPRTFGGQVAGHVAASILSSIHRRRSLCPSGVPGTDQLPPARDDLAFAEQWRARGALTALPFREQLLGVMPENSIF